MGKNKKSSGEDLQRLSIRVSKEIHQIISDIRSLWAVTDDIHNKLNALDSYLGLYVEWKGDKYRFNKYLEEKFNTKDKEDKPKEIKQKNEKQNIDVKKRKQERYRKVAENARR